MSNKRSDYAELVQQRKDCRLCEGLTNPADPQLCEHDSEEIGPWSRLHGDLDADILVVGQDWGDVKYFQKNAGLDKLNNPTMKTLQELLQSVGLNVSLTTYGQAPAKLFLTNAVLCLT